MALIFHFKCTLKCPLQFVSVWTGLKFCHLRHIHVIKSFADDNNFKLYMEAKKTMCEKEEMMGNQNFFLFPQLSKTFSFSRSLAPPGWLIGKRVRLMTWWLWVWDLVEVKFLSDVLSSLNSAGACEKSSWWLWKESCVRTSTGVTKPGNTRRVQRISWFLLVRLPFCTCPSVRQRRIIHLPWPSFS